MHLARSLASELSRLEMLSTRRHLSSSRPPLLAFSQGSLLQLSGPTERLRASVPHTAAHRIRPSKLLSPSAAEIRIREPICLRTQWGREDEAALAITDTATGSFVRRTIHVRITALQSAATPLLASMEDSVLSRGREQTHSGTWSVGIEGEDAAARCHNVSRCRYTHLAAGRVLQALAAHFRIDWSVRSHSRLARP